MGDPSADFEEASQGVVLSQRAGSPFIVPMPPMITLVKGHAHVWWQAGGHQTAACLIQAKLQATVAATAGWRVR